MFVELAKKLREVNSDLSILLHVDGTLFTLGVFNPKEDVAYYSFSSSNLFEVYSRVNHYITCLKDSDKMNDLVKEVTNGNLEVVNV